MTPRILLLKNDIDANVLEPEEEYKSMMRESSMSMIDISTQNIYYLEKESGFKV